VKALHAANVVFFAILTLASSRARADWVSTNGPVGANTRAFTFSNGGSRLLAGTDGAGVFVANAGYSGWTAVNGALTDSSVVALSAGTNEWGSELVLAGTRGGGVFASYDHGTSWTPRNLGARPPDTARALAIVADPYFGNGLLLFQGGDRGVFRSNGGDLSTSWWPANTGLRTPHVLALISVWDGGDPDDGNGAHDLYAGTNGGGVFVSVDGVYWVSKSEGLTSMVVRALAASSSYAVVFAGTAGGGVFRSTSTYASWTVVNDGLGNRNVRALATVGTTVFAGTASGVFVASDDAEGAWIEENAGLADLDVSALATDGVNLFAATSSGVYRRAVSELVP
jgi:hypothetical protein